MIVDLVWVSRDRLGPQRATAQEYRMPCSRANRGSQPLTCGTSPDDHEDDDAAEARRWPPSTSTSCCASRTSPSTASAAAREEIDALNVYPVPDGDTGTNMFLTCRPPATRSGRPPAATPEPTCGTALRGLLPRRPARCPRQLRRDPSQLVGALVAPASAEAGPRRPAAPRCSPRRCSWPPSRLRRSRRAGRGHDPLRRPGRQRGGRGRRRRAPRPAGSATSSTQAAAEAREALEPHARAAAAAQAGRGRRRRRPRPVRDPRRRRDRAHRPRPGASRRRRRQHAIPMPMPAPATYRGRPAYEVMYLLDAEDDADPGLREQLGAARRLARGRRRRGPVERPRPRRRRRCRDRGRHRGRAARTGSGSPTSPSRSAGRQPAGTAAARRAARSWPSRPAPGWPQLFAEAGAVVVRRARAPAQRPGRSSRRSTTCGADEVVVLPNDPDSCRVAEIAARTAEETRRGSRSR